MVYVSSNTGMYASGAASYASSSTFSEYHTSSSSKKNSVCCGSFQRGARCYSCPGAC